MSQSKGDDKKRQESRSSYGFARKKSKMWEPDDSSDEHDDNMPSTSKVISNSLKQVLYFLEIFNSKCFNLCVL